MKDNKSQINHQIIDIVLDVDHPVVGFVQHFRLRDLVVGVALVLLAHVLGLLDHHFLRFFLCLYRQVLLQLFLEFFHQVWVLDVDWLFLLGFVVDWTGAFLEEGCVGGEDFLGRVQDTSFWNMISCLISFLMEKPARDFLLLKTSLSMKVSKTVEISGAE